MLMKAVMGVFVPPVLISQNTNNRNVPDLTEGWLSRLLAVVSWIRCMLISSQ